MTDAQSDPTSTVGMRHDIHESTPKSTRPEAEDSREFWFVVLLPAAPQLWDPPTAGAESAPAAVPRCALTSESEQPRSHRNSTPGFLLLPSLGSQTFSPGPQDSICRSQRHSCHPRNIFCQSWTAGGSVIARAPKLLKKQLQVSLCPKPAVHFVRLTHVHLYISRNTISTQGRKIVLEAASDMPQQLNVFQNSSEHLWKYKNSLHGSEEEAVCHHEGSTASAHVMERGGAPGKEV
ncbi:MAG: hypothetical protein FRX49_12609 [Trebouxia sp. A1-2]|nr:MAG: hypothetical protein FRX49_12609 [Trebouxia sp. A1-2]